MNEKGLDFASMLSAYVPNERHTGELEFYEIAYWLYSYYTTVR